MLLFDVFGEKNSPFRCPGQKRATSSPVKKAFNQSLSQKCTCSQKSTRQPDEVGCSGRAGRHFQRLHIPVVGAGSARGPAPKCLQIYRILACVPVHKVELVKMFQDSFKTC